MITSGPCACLRRRLLLQVLRHSAILYLSSLGLLFSNGCSERSTPTESPVAPTPLSASGVTLTLLDGSGGTIEIRGKDPAPELDVEVGSSVRFSVTPQWAEGTHDSSRQWIATTVPPDRSTSGLATIRRSEDVIELTGARTGMMSLTLSLEAQGFALYETAEIPIRVQTDVRGFRFLTPGSTIYEQTPFRESAPIRILDGTTLDIAVAFLDGKGQPIDAEDLGPETEMQFSVEPPEILEVELDSSDPYSLVLSTLKVGAATAQLELVRRGHISYQSRNIEIEVAEPPGWSPSFDREHAPNGPVHGLVVFDDRLFVHGEFTQVGTEQANGLAAWNGKTWAPVESPPGSLKWLFLAGDDLVAGGVNGFFRLDDQSWEFLAPPNPGAHAPVYFRGQLLVLVGRPYTWTGFDWELLDRSSPVYPISFYSVLTKHEGALWAGGDWIGGGTCPYHSSIDRTEDGGWIRERDLGCGPCEYCEGTAMYLDSVGGSVLMQWLVTSRWDSYFKLELYRDGTWIDLGVTSRIHASAGLDGEVYLASRQTIYTIEDLIPLAEVEGGEVHVAEEYRGRVYFGGSFNVVGGVQSFNIAAYSP